jgi:FixJ family two-component response regulator
MVYVVDDDRDVRDSVKWILGSVGYRVKVFADAQTCLEQVEGDEPICFLVDLLLPGMTGLRLCQEFLTGHPSFAFVLISGHADVPSAVEAMKLGAVDFLEKPFSRERLLAVVHEAMRLATCRQKKVAEEDDVEERLNTLSAREREVFQCMAEGLATKQIARSLGISNKTIDVHRSKIMKKLQVDTPTQLGRLFYLSNRHRERSRSATPSVYRET